MDYVLKMFGTARAVSDVVDYSTNDYIHRASVIFKSADPPTPKELKEVIALYGEKNGDQGFHKVVAVTNNSIGMSSAEQVQNRAILMAKIIKRRIDLGKYNNIITKLGATPDEFLVVLFKKAQLKYAGSFWKSSKLNEYLDIQNTNPKEKYKIQYNNIAKTLSADFFSDYKENGPKFIDLKKSIDQYKKNGKLTAGWLWGGKRRTRRHNIRGKNNRTKHYRKI